MTVTCGVCDSTGLKVFALAGLQRGACVACFHEQRLDIEPFDYTVFAMGAAGAKTVRIAEQAAFLARHVRPGASILEIGCAAGLVAQALRPLVAIGRYDGLDLSPAGAEARQHLDELFTIPLPALQAGGMISGQSYDLVVSSHCLEHVRDIKIEIAAMRRVLSPTGVIFIEVPNRSGHPALPFDDNRSHLHFFSVSSLTRLLARHGLDAIVVETGARHDSRYPDCIRVVPRANVDDQEWLPLLSAGRKISEAKCLIVWGAGKIALELLAHYFDTWKISFFVDKDERKHGALCLGRVVKPPDAINIHLECTILVNSLEYDGVIRDEIETRFAAARPVIVTLEEILDDLLPHTTGDDSSSSATRFDRWRR